MSRPQLTITCFAPPPVPERSKGDTRGKLFLRKILDDVKRKASAISV